MAAPRKRRTREHVIADLSRVHVQSAFIEAGHVADVVPSDYGYDLTVTTFDPDGYEEPGEALIQLKASDTISRGETAAGLAFDVDVRDYHAWTGSTDPVYLVLFDAVGKVGYWLYVQRHFAPDSSRRPRPGAKTVRVRVPRANIVAPAFVAAVRDDIARIQAQLIEVASHAPERPEAPADV